jgi:hypothetical protein
MSDMSEREGHPEDRCERCGGANVSWFAPSDIWNRAVRAVTGGEDVMICPVCFIKAAEAAGFDKAAWRVAPESSPLDHDHDPAKCLTCRESPASPLPSDPAVEAYYAAREALRVTHQDEPPLPFRKVIIAADVLAARVEALRAENANVVAAMHQYRVDYFSGRDDINRLRDTLKAAEARVLKAERDTEEARTKGNALRDALAAIKAMLGPGSEYTVKRDDGGKMDITQVVMVGNVFEKASAAMTAWEATLSEGEQKV